MKCANPKCGREFEPRHGHQKYCSLKCRRQNDYLRHKAERNAKNRDYRAANSEMLNWKHKIWRVTGKYPKGKLT